MPRWAIPLAVVLASVTAACSSVSGPPSAPPRRLSADQITPAAALRVFDTFLDRYRELNKKYSPALNDSITSGWLNDEVAFDVATHPPGEQGIIMLGHGAPGGQRVFVPRLAGYPRWFLASGNLDGTASTANIYVLTQPAPSAAWKAVAQVSDFAGTGPWQTPVLDSAGYATAVRLSQPGLVAAPSQLASLYLRQLNSGSGHMFPDFKLNPGPGYVSEAKSGKLGWHVSIRWLRFPQHVYALAAADGRVIVIFPEYQQFTWTALSARARLLPSSNNLVGEFFYGPWPEFARLARVASVRKGLRISLDTVYDFLAVDGPASQASAVPLTNADTDYVGVSSS